MGSAERVEGVSSVGGTDEALSVTDLLLSDLPVSDLVESDLLVSSAIYKSKCISIREEHQKRSNGGNFGNVDKEK